ncbi:DNA starvation/stationary phase protection protein [Streptomyces sp. NPDC019224]|uniref:Dps family protein n=1 Tax=Streptomyces sp. NPDC019224 TaxID=3154484 RepID=UPI0033C5F7D6
MESTITAPPHGGGRPLLHQKGAETQTFGTLEQLPIGFGHDTRRYACQRLNRVLADTQIRYSLYKKHHWLMRGAAFCSLHLMLDKHAKAQPALVDAPAERIRSLGAVSVGDPRHGAELTSVPRTPDGVEPVPAMPSRLLDAHERILTDARDAAARISAEGDEGSTDLPVSDVIRTGEAQVRFLAEHLVATPLARG